MNIFDKTSEAGNKDKPNDYSKRSSYTYVCEFLETFLILDSKPDISL